jgi:hypothetical protein
MKFLARFTLQHTLRRHPHCCLFLPSSISTCNYLLIQRLGVVVYFHLSVSVNSARRCLSVSTKRYDIHNEVTLLNPRYLAKYFIVGSSDKLKQQVTLIM